MSLSIRKAGGLPRTFGQMYELEFFLVIFTTEMTILELVCKCFTKFFTEMPKLFFQLFITFFSAIH